MGISQESCGRIECESHGLKKIPTGIKFRRHARASARCPFCYPDWQPLISGGKKSRGKVNYICISDRLTAQKQIVIGYSMATWQVAVICSIFNFDAFYVISAKADPTSYVYARALMYNDTETW